MRFAACAKSIRKRNAQRGGAVLICVLACVIIVTSLVTISLSMHSRSRRESKRIVQLRQVELLLDAGIARAIEQLQQSASYSGEAWEMPQTVVGSDGARVEIAVERSDADEGLPAASAATETVFASTRAVTVVAALGNAAFADDAVQRSFTFRVEQ